MQVIGVRRTIRSGEPLPNGVTRVITATQLPEVLPDADALVLALPGTAETRGMLTHDLIALLPRRAVVVNVGRGTTIDESALIDALREDRLTGAALDVTAVEPLPADSPLWAMPNVLLSTHTAAASADQDVKRIDLAVDNLHRFLDGRPLRNLVDPVQFY
jgi:phosphoglycerate dehydrogenase-like enzyme